MANSDGSDKRDEVFHTPEGALDSGDGDMTLKMMLSTIENDAREVLACEGYDAAFPRPNASTPARVYDAYQIIFYARSLREAVNRRPSRAALERCAHMAFSVGLLFERLRLGPLEPHAVRGVKVQEAARAGHVENHGTDAEKRAIWTAMFKRWNELRDKHDELTDGAIDAMVAAEFLKKDGEPYGAKTIRRVRNEYIDRLNIEE